MRGIITRLMSLGYLDTLRLLNEAKSAATECRTYARYRPIKLYYRYNHNHLLNQGSLCADSQPNTGKKPNTHKCRALFHFISRSDFSERRILF